MMKKTDNLSRTIQVGRIANVSDLKTNISDGRQCVHFTLAINKMEDKPDYYNCISYNAIARYIERYIRKGAKVLILGNEKITVKKSANGLFYKSVFIEAEKVLEADSEKARQVLEIINSIFDN